MAKPEKDASVFAREFGRDASEAHERDADTVKKYLG